MGIRIYSNDKEKVLKESEEVRQIVSVIMDYGISQKQILYIIHDLAMNLENNNHIKRIRVLLKDLMEDRLIVKSPLEL